MSNPLKILENLTPTPSWNISSAKKGKTHFLKKQKILFPTLINNTHLNVEIWMYSLQNLKIKGELGVV